jgi:ElaB/YqjD/DUF883 family membrane-anchored ribosome-binding protein
MTKDHDDKVDELAADLDDLKLTVEELQDEAPSDDDAQKLARVTTALEQASDATEEAGNRGQGEPDENSAG